MDLSVQAAMAKWPDVPAIFGWLRLDARGQWWLHDDRLRHPLMEAFFQRNYTRDDQGRYFVQNGPQKVYVGLESAPFVARRQEGGWRRSPGGQSVWRARPSLRRMDNCCWSLMAILLWWTTAT